MFSIYVIKADIWRERKIDETGWLFHYHVWPGSIPFANHPHRKKTECYQFGPESKRQSILIIASLTWLPECCYDADFFVSSPKSVMKGARFTDLVAIEQHIMVGVWLIRTEALPEILWKLPKGERPLKIKLIVSFSLIVSWQHLPKFLGTLCIFISLMKIIMTL